MLTLALAVAPVILWVHHSVRTDLSTARTCVFFQLQLHLDLRDLRMACDGSVGTVGGVEAEHRHRMTIRGRL